MLPCNFPRLDSMGNEIPVDTALSERAKLTVAKIKSWDRQDIMELHGWLMELKKIVALFDQDPTWYIASNQIPTVPLPKEIGAEEVWGCDLHGICLVKERTEFTFRARSLSELVPGSAAAAASADRQLELLRSTKKHRVTVQFSQREYAGIVRAMNQDEEPKIARWIRATLLKEIHLRGIKT